MNQPIRRALLSVSDKTGLVELSRSLMEMGVELVSTGGTARALTEAGLEVRDVSSLTGFPEMMDGRVKTLHPAVHGGLLAVRGNAQHEAAQRSHGIGNIDLLVVNLYPFEDTIAGDADWDTAIENIDVGGPAMIRAASKNHRSVTVIVDPSDYEPVLAEMREHGCATLSATRKLLAAKAFARTAAYDAAIAQWFGQRLNAPLPGYFAIGGKRLQALRYGENPHQRAAVYRVAGQSGGVASARQLQGKELSYNNFNDTDAALECLSEFASSGSVACVIVKHANPCGVAVADSPLEAYRKALRCDPVSAFGGIIALNRTLDAATAREIVSLFTEVIVAPGVDDEAQAILATKSNLRLLIVDHLRPPLTGISVKTIGGGLLVQEQDDGQASRSTWKTVTKRLPTEAEFRDLEFAFRVAKHVKSNAIVYAKDGATVGIGAGQMSRVDSVRIAARKSMDAAEAVGSAEPLVRGSVVASDAFFPFADGLLQAAEAGATAVVQPGGSIKDDEIIRAAEAAGLAMVLTGMRHFRH